MRVFLLALALMNAPFSGANWLDLQAMAHVDADTSRLDIHQELQEAADSLAKQPTDARVDRVWHAIPGLAGWRLDVAASERQTEAGKGDTLHLVWHKVYPDQRLKDLPAEPIYRGPATERSVSLMFNVSWGEEFVPGILKVLREKHAKATFFLDGNWVEKHPDLTREIAAQGHVIGSHGSGHPDFQRITTARLQQQVVDTNSRIHRVTGVTPTLLAPPGGSFDKRTVQQGAQHGMYTILWTVDTIDWRRPPADAIVSRVKQNLSPGILILMHPTKPTLQALPALLDTVQGQGYTAKTLDMVIKEEPVVAPPLTLRARS